MIYQYNGRGIRTKIAAASSIALITRKRALGARVFVYPSLVRTQGTTERGILIFLFDRIYRYILYTLLLIV